MSFSAIRRRLFLAALPAAAALLGCRLFHPPEPLPEEIVEAGGNLVPNPLFIPAGDREFIWNQIVDELDNYFVILREERVQNIGGILTEGQIVTRPQVGATFLEPWRADSTSRYERTLATLQSIRRTARARVIPVEDGQLLDVMVLKELEHMDRPAQATAGAMIAPHDQSVVREQVPPGTFSITPGWIPQGRDVALEQRILNNLRGRLCDPNTPATLPKDITTEFSHWLATPSRFPATARRSSRNWRSCGASCGNCWLPKALTALRRSTPSSYSATVCLPKWRRPRGCRIPKSIY